MVEMKKLGVIGEIGEIHIIGSNNTDLLHIIGGKKWIVLLSPIQLEADTSINNIRTYFT